MHKKIKIEFYDEETNISIQNVHVKCEDGHEAHMVEINIGAWQDHTGGNDGESIFMEADDFQEFLSECQALLTYLVKLEEAEEDA